MQEEEQKIPDKETGTEEKLIQAKKEIQLLNNQLESAMKSIDKLIRKLTELENSKLIKFRKYFYHYLAKLRSNFKKGEKKNIFSILVNYVFGRGAHILRFLISKILKALYLLFEIKNVIIVEVAEGFLATSTDYSQYLYRKQITKNRLKFMQKQISSFEKKPLFSIIIPVYDPPVEFLQQALDSVIKQIYPPYEICIADDCSNDPEVKKTLDEYIQKYPSVMVVYRTENGHISKATNTALELATGEYAVFMDQDDILREDTLFHMAALINKQEKVDLIYTDEDKIDEWNIHKEPHFKPDWSPDNLLSRNYFGHICAYRLDQVRMLNGFRVGYEGSQDYDLALRYTERFTSIYHIPEVLYHWRIHSESAAAGEFAKPYAYRSAQRALSEALMRRGWPARIEFLEGFRGYAARLEILDKNKLVSIILPAKNKAGYLDRCLYSIDAKSTYRNFEIILIDNNSDEDDFFRIVNKYKDKRSFTLKYVRDEGEFNFSRIINLGRKNATGDYLLLLNNDTEVISPDWLEGFIEHAQRPETGVVGCKLLYPDMTIQHAGVVIGLGGAAGHILLGEDRYGPGYFNYVNLLNNYSALTGACFLVRTSVFDEVGGFDEGFTIEYNDVDFCLKVREAGYHNIYVPNVELFHYESITRGHPHSTQESFRLHVKEVNMFRKRWERYVENDPCYNPNLSLGVHNFGLKA